VHHTGGASFFVPCVALQPTLDTPTALPPLARSYCTFASRPTTTEITTCRGGLTLRIALRATPVPPPRCHAVVRYGRSARIALMSNVQPPSPPAPLPLPAARVAARFASRHDSADHAAGARMVVGRQCHHPEDGGPVGALSTASHTWRTAPPSSCTSCSRGRAASRSSQRCGRACPAASCAHSSSLT
jgi:hypothetical protein